MAAQTPTTETRTSDGKVSLIVGQDGVRVTTCDTRGHDYVLLAIRLPDWAIDEIYHYRQRQGPVGWLPNVDTYR